MKRMALSDAEAEVIRGLRIERNIYNQAIADVVQALTVDGPCSEHAQGDNLAFSIIETILALRKE